jgi:hypothetical protein
MKRPGYSATHADLSAAVERLGVELRECLEAVLPSLDGARACGRALGLKRQLGWRIYTVATSSDLPSVLAALPRRAGWALAMQGLRKAGCPDRKHRRLEQSVADVLRLIEPGRMSRAMLRSLAAGRLDGPKRTAELLRARRAMRLAAEDLYGAGCALQVAMFVLGRADDEGWIDMVSALAYDGLRRPRPGPPVAIKWVTRASPGGAAPKRPSRPLGASGREGWLVADLSTPGVWNDRLRVEDAAVGPIIWLASGGEPEAVPLRTVFAEFLPRAGTVGWPDDRVVLQVMPMIPTELCILDVWIHRSVRRITEPSASLRDSMHLATPGGDAVDTVSLPLEAQAAPVTGPGLPPEFASLDGVHAELLSRAAKQLGAAPTDFVGFRVVVPDPPTGTTVSLRWRM